MEKFKEVLKIVVITIISVFIIFLILGFFIEEEYIPVEEDSSTEEDDVATAILTGDQEAYTLSKGGYPYSNEFGQVIKEVEGFKGKDGFGQEIISFGADGHFYNFSYLQPLLWFTSKFTPFYYYTENKNQGAMGAIFLTNESQPFNEYIDCESYVKKVFTGEGEVEINKTEEVIVDGKKYKRVYYTTEKLQGIDQCYVEEDAVIVFFGNIFPELSEEHGVGMSYEQLETVMDNVSLIRIDIPALDKET